MTSKVTDSSGTSKGDHEVQRLFLSLVVANAIDLVIGWAGLLAFDVIVICLTYTPYTWYRQWWMGTNEFGVVFRSHLSVIRDLQRQ